MIDLLQWLALIPVLGGSVFAVLSTVAVLRFMARGAGRLAPPQPYQPPVSILKPVHGLEKDLKEGLRTACLQDYPEYQVVYSVQDPGDPALPLLYELQEEFGGERVSVVVDDFNVGANGKVNNLMGALRAARHEILVISDSDTRLDAGYLSAIVAPLADPEVGLSCTPFKVARARRWYEKMELLSINADFMPSVMFAEVTGASNSCMGPSVAFKRSTLEDIGGLESLADYLVEDYELGRRIWTSGLRMVLVPHLIEVVVDLADVKQWWIHQIYWDQNTRVARPGAFFSTILIRAVPFALIFALLNPGAPWAWAVLGATVGIRIVTAAITLKWGLRDGEGLSCVALLPIRDVAGLAVWALSFTKRTVVWRGVEFTLERSGRMVPLRTVS